ncbi:MAG: amidohydrolase family protein [Anaerolineae bacterium]|nr:amidohydrolase family protein [Anaerolineae bacterium]
MNKTLFRNSRFLISRPTPFGGILEDGAVYVEGPHIKAVGPSAEIEAQYGDQEGLEIIDCRNKIVMPGLVDSHNHVGEAQMFLIFGWLDTPLQGIVDTAIRVLWPAYNWLTEESVYDLTLFGLVNMLKHGTTTYANAFTFPDAVYRAAAYARMRTVIHVQMITSVNLPDARNEQEYLALTEDAIKNYHNTHDGLIQVGVHPSATYNCTQSMLIKGLELAEQYDVQYATHVAEAPDEKGRADATWADEGGQIQHLKNIGLMSPRSLFFHGAALNEREIDMLAETGTALAHCPPTNSILGNCAYLPYMLQAGVKVGLGTDCPTHNLFNVMLSVSQQHNIMPREMRGLMPWTPFELATTGGARALRLEDKIGALEPGKRADIVTIDLRRNTGLFPLNVGNLLTFLAFNGPGVEVADAMVDGQFLRRDGEFTIFDEEAIIAKAQEWCDKFTMDWFAAQKSGDPMFNRVHEEYQRL